MIHPWYGFNVTVCMFLKQFCMSDVLHFIWHPTVVICVWIMASRIFEHDKTYVTTTFSFLCKQANSPVGGGYALLCHRACHNTTQINICDDISSCVIYWHLTAVLVPFAWAATQAMGDPMATTCNNPVDACMVGHICMTIITCHVCLSITACQGALAIVASHAW